MKANIEDILDQCIEDIQAGKSMEDVLKACPDVAAELRPLLQLAVKLEQLPTPEPSVQGLVRAMAHSVVDAERPQRRSKGRLLLFPSPVLARVAASIAFIFLLGWGTTVASSDAVPGDFLYPVKRFTERVKFFLTINNENQAELRIVFSEERLAEAVKMHARGEGVDDVLLATMLEQARLAVEDAGDLPVAERKRVLARAASATAYQKQVLADMRESASEGEREKLDRWMERCRSRWEWMCGMPQQDGSPTQETPSEGGTKPAPRTWRENCMRNCPMW
jgi:hypothetical protein